MVMEVMDRNYALLLQGSEMSAGWHFRNLILGLDFCRIVVLTVCLKHNDRRGRRPNLVNWSARYAAAKTLEGEESILSTLFCGQLLLICFWLIHAVDEFSLNENEEVVSVHYFILLSMCLVRIKIIKRQEDTWCLTPMVESLSADFLPAIESYCTESHLEFCQTSTTELQKYVEHF